MPKTVAAMREAGIADADIEKLIVWSNPVAFFGQAAGSIASARSIDGAVGGQLRTARRTETRGRAGVGALLAGRIERRCRSSGY